MQSKTYKNKFNWQHIVVNIENFSHKFWCVRAYASVHTPFSAFNDATMFFAHTNVNFISWNANITITKRLASRKTALEGALGKERTNDRRKRKRHKKNNELKVFGTQLRNFFYALCVAWSMHFVGNNYNNVWKNNLKIIQIYGELKLIII